MIQKLSDECRRAFGSRGTRRDGGSRGHHWKIVMVLFFGFGVILHNHFWTAFVIFLLYGSGDDFLLLLKNKSLKEVQKSAYEILNDVHSKLLRERPIISTYQKFAAIAFSFALKAFLKYPIFIKGRGKIMRFCGRRYHMFQRIHFSILSSQSWTAIGIILLNGLIVLPNNFANSTIAVSQRRLPLYVLPVIPVKKRAVFLCLHFWRQFF